MFERNVAISLTVNGERQEIADAPPDMHLAHYLREVLGLTGTRVGCSIGECRACTVMVRHLPGEPPVTKQACMVSLRHVQDWDVTTVEGLAPSGELHPVQKAILDEDAFQCGYCAAGFAVAGAVAYDQMAADPSQDINQVVEAITGHNLCRCTGYFRYRRAIVQAVATVAAPSPGKLAFSTRVFEAFSGEQLKQLHYHPLFGSPRLELVRLLRDAAEIEHSLLVQYLYAAFSIRIPRYSSLAGWPSHRYGGRPLHLLGVAIEEMVHLNVVNSLLVALGAAPHLGRQQFPYEQDIYPFEFRLEPLSPASLAKYVYVEASATAIDPAHQTTDEDKVFVAYLYELLARDGAVIRPNRVGSLYQKIEAVLDLLQEEEPALIDYPYWKSQLAEVREEGESEHYLLFRSILEGTHAALPGPEVWNSNHPDHPVIALHVQSGLPAAGQEIPDEEIPVLRHLSNLHYWCVCMLLDQSYRRSGRLLSAARRHMAGPMRSLATALAKHGEGVPFDPFPSGYAPGRDDDHNLRLTQAMVNEATVAEQRFARYLPADYAPRCAVETAQELHVVHLGSPAPIGHETVVERKTEL
jgi:aerobic-type carbon monoxide dehydrogenase small subunit (CoxS/CutS family)